MVRVVFHNVKPLMPTILVTNHLTIQEDEDIDDLTAVSSPMANSIVFGANAKRTSEAMKGNKISSLGKLTPGGESAEGPTDADISADGDATIMVTTAM
eukprot:535213-Pyramimonas_sp.AAC.1